jgi:hypothetical protein
MARRASRLSNSVSCISGNTIRRNMPLGSYFIRKDTNAILSYTHDGDVFRSIRSTPTPTSRRGIYFSKNSTSSPTGGMVYPC